MFKFLLLMALVCHSIVVFGQASCKIGESELHIRTSDKDVDELKEDVFKALGRSDCFDSRGNIVIPDPEINNEEFDSIAKSYEKMYLKNFGKEVWNKHLTTEVSEGVTEHQMVIAYVKAMTQEYKKQKIEEVKKMMDEHLKNIEKHTDNGKDIYGAICLKLDSISQDVKNPFKAHSLTLFADEAKKTPANITKEEFEFIKADFYKQLDTNPDLADDETMKWLLGCQLKDEKDKSTSATVVCLIPQFEIKGEKQLLFASKKWLPLPKLVNKELSAYADNKPNWKKACSILVKKRKGKQDKKALAMQLTNPFAEKRIEGKEFTKREIPKGKKDKVLRGSVEGVVFNDLTKEPLSGASVKILTSPLASVSKEDGKFDFKDIELINKGKIIKAEHKSFDPDQTPMDVLTPNRLTDKYELSLKPKQVDVQGTVTRSDTNVPITSEKITVTFFLTLNDGSLFSVSREAQVDAKGNYKITKIPAIYDKVTVQQTSNAFKPKILETVAINPDLPVNKINFALEAKTTLLAGQISDTKSGEALSGIAVKLVGSDGKKFAEGVTDENGNYEFEIKDNPLKWDIDKDGKRKPLTLSVQVDEAAGVEDLYHPQTLKQKMLQIQDVPDRDRNTTQAFSDVEAGLLKYESNPNRDVELKPRFGVLTGTVLDAKTGEPVAGATVQITIRGKNHKITTQDGSYTFRHVPAGNYTLAASKKGYFENSVKFKMPETGDLNKNVIILPEEYGRNRIIITLTWLDSPRDLDSQVFNNKYLINYKTLREGYNDLTTGAFAKLDLDNTSGFGPETTIIQLDKNNRPLTPMPYKFMIYNYSGEKSVFNSGAEVTVFKDGKVIGSIKSTEIAAGNQSRLWHALDVINGEVVIINKLKFKQEYDFISSKQKEIEGINKKIATHEEQLAKMEGLLGDFEKAKQSMTKSWKDLYELTGSKEAWTQYFGSAAGYNPNFKGNLAKIEQEIVDLTFLKKNYNPSQLAQVKANLAKLEAQRSTLAAAQEKTPLQVKEMEELDFDINMKQRSIASMERNDFDGMLKELKAQSKAAQDQIAKLKNAELPELKKKVAELGKKIEQSGAKGDDLKKLSEAINVKIEAEKKKIVQATEQIQKKEDEIVKNLGSFQ